MVMCTAPSTCRDASWLSTPWKIRADIRAREVLIEGLVRGDVHATATVAIFREPENSSEGSGPPVFASSQGLSSAEAWT